MTIIKISPSLSIDFSDLKAVETILGTEKFSKLKEFNTILPSLQEVLDLANSQEPPLAVDPVDLENYKDYTEKNGLLKRSSIVVNLFKILGGKSVIELPLSSEDIVSKEQFTKLVQSNLILTNVEYEKILDEFSVQAQLETIKGLHNIEEIIIGCGKNFPSLILPLSVPNINFNINILITCSCDKRNDSKKILTVTVEGMEADILNFDALSLENWQALKQKIPQVKSIKDHTLFLYREKDCSIGIENNTYNSSRKNCFEFWKNEMLTPDGSVTFWDSTSSTEKPIESSPWYQEVYMAGET